MSCGITYNEDAARGLLENWPFDGVVLRYDDDMDDSSTAAAIANFSIENTN